MRHVVGMGLRFGPLPWYNTIVTIFGDRIRFLRQEHHLKQTDFHAYGISQSQLSLIENGESAPCAEKIEVLANVFERLPADLVAGTELEMGYAAARAVQGFATPLDRAEDLSRSARAIAVEESYKRILLFHGLLADPDARYRRDVANERYYQYCARILRRALAAAKQLDPALGERVEFPKSIMDEPCENAERLRLAMIKSLAYVQSLTLEYPEADDEASRRDILLGLGLAKIDRHLASFGQAGAAVLRLVPQSARQDATTPDGTDASET